MTTSDRTRLAVLGTLADLHREPLVYDLACLRSLVADIAPDLLCAEIIRDVWERHDLSAASLEVREALAPIEAATDIVVVPVAASMKSYAGFLPANPRRRNLVRLFDRLLRWGQRQANRPEAVNGVLFGAFCHTVCWLAERLWTLEQQADWGVQNSAMAENILQAARRDPGRRILVVVQCQRLHRLLPMLHAHPAVLEIVNYQAL